MPAKGTGRPVAERFWEKVAKRGIDDCWLWTGGVTTNYGQLTGDGYYPSGKRIAVKAHRLSYELAHGPIPDGKSVLHKCDVPLCVNPEHLFLGDHLANMRDRLAKGRHPRVRGTQNGQAILNEDQVLKIKALKGIRPASVPAEEYGVHVATIYDIWKGKNWAWL